MLVTASDHISLHFWPTKKIAFYSNCAIESPFKHGTFYDLEILINYLEFCLLNDVFSNYSISKIVRLLPFKAGYGLIVKKKWLVNSKLTKLRRPHHRTLKFLQKTRCNSKYEIIFVCHFGSFFLFCLILRHSRVNSII